MSYKIIQIDDGSYDEAVADMFARHNYHLVKREWVEWKYAKNPHGRATLILAVDDNGTPVGQVALVPRRFHHGEKQIMSAQAVDGFVDPNYRRQGILQKGMNKLKETAHERNILLTAFSDIDDISLGAVRKGGYYQLAFFEIMACPLRPSVIFSHKKGSVITVPLTKASLDIVSKQKFLSKNTEVEAREITRFDSDEDFPSRTLRGVRDAAYLNWRYVDNPIDKYKVVGLYHHEEKIGFVALKFDRDGYTAHMHDFIVTGHEVEAIIELQKFVYNNYPSIGLLTLASLENGPFHSALVQCGFKSRGNKHLVSLSNHESMEVSTDPAQWLVTLSDSDW